MLPRGMPKKVDEVGQVLCGQSQCWSTYSTPVRTFD